MTVPYTFANQGGSGVASVPAAELDENFSYLDTKTAGSSTNLAGGLENQIPIQLAAGNTTFVDAPSIGGTVLIWDGSEVGWGGVSTPNEWPDPQNQMSQMGAIVAENPTLTGTIAALPVQSYTWAGWYTAGSATFTNGSPTVVGVGTLWASGSPQNVQPGDWINVPTRPDANGKVIYYPVKSVNSNTSITLGLPSGASQNYGETTASSASYIATGYFSRSNPGPRVIQVNSNDTFNLKNNDLIEMETTGSHDPVLTATPLRVTNVVPNTSFTVCPEYTSGLPNPANMGSGSPLTNYIITRQGDITGASGGSVSIGLNKFADGTSWPHVYLDDTPDFTTHFKGMARVVLFQKVTTGTEFLYYQAPATAYPVLANTRRSAGMAVYIPAGGGGISASSYIYDGVTRFSGNAVTGAAARTWTAVSATINAAPTTLQYGVQFTGPIGTWFIVGEFFQSSGINIADGVFSTPLNQTVVAPASYSPWNSLQIIGPVTLDASATTFGISMDMYQQSGGLIGLGASAIFALLEGQTNVAAGAFGFRNNMVSPTIFSNAMYQEVAQPVGTAASYMTSSGMLPLDNGYCVWNAKFQGELFQFMSFDMSRFVLWTSTF